MRAGIDLGTTNSLIARLKSDGSTIIVPDSNFHHLDFTPSSVILGDGSALVGTLAEAKLEANPEANMVRFFKRNFGQATPLLKDGNGNDWYAASIAALVLKKLIKDYEFQVGEPLEEIVVTVPAHFNDKQRKSVIYAANMAEIPLKGILEEPYAAALHYGVQIPKKEETLMFVYDLGGGTFDASVIAMNDQQFQVLAKGGHSQIGGKEFDEAIMAKISQAVGPSVANWNAAKLLQLRRVAESIKKELSLPEKTFFKKQIIIGDWNKTMLFNRLEFEALIRPMIQETINISKKCILNAGLQPKDIDAFLMVGGGSQIPLIQKLLIQEMGVGTEKIKFTQPMRAIAYGAALRTAQLSGQILNDRLPPEFKGVTGFNIGVRTFNRQTGKLDLDTLIYKNYPLPARATRLYYTKDDQQTSITLELAQYLENKQQAETVGTIHIGPIMNPRANYMVEVIVENTIEGLIKVKAYDPQTGQEIGQTFSNRPESSLFMLQQQALVRNTIVN